MKVAYQERVLAFIWLAIAVPWRMMLHCVSAKVEPGKIFLPDDPALAYFEVDEREGHIFSCRAKSIFNASIFSVKSDLWKSEFVILTRMLVWTVFLSQKLWIIITPTLINVAWGTARFWVWIWPRTFILCHPSLSHLFLLTLINEYFKTLKYNWKFSRLQSSL